MSSRAKRSSASNGRTSSPSPKATKRSSASNSPSKRPAKQQKKAAAAPVRQDREAGEVFSVGSGDMGQLGFGPEFQERRKFGGVPALKGKPVTHIASGALHNAVVSEGAVYTWGCNDDAANGRDGDEWIPDKVVGLEEKKVIQVECGDCHSIALTEDGEVFSWGSYKNNNGIIGYNKLVEKRSTAGLVESLKAYKIIQVACGENHDVVLTEHGQVFEWGDVRLGQRQSSRVVKEKLVPRLVNFGKRVHIRGVFANGYSSFAVTKDNKVYAWGLNNYGQAGIGDTRDLLVPTLIPALSDIPQIKKIAGGIHHTMLLTEDGKVYSFGRGHYGRLGHGEEKDQPLPKLIEALQWGDDSVADIACGTNHSMAVTKNGKLYTWGYGDLLQLGNADEKDEPVPFLVPVNNYNGLQVSGGAQHSLVLFKKKDQ